MSWLDTLEQIQHRDFSKATQKERDKVSREVVNLASYACAVTAVVPLPFSDALLMLPIQSAMVMTIGHIHGRKVDRAAARDMVTELAAVAGASFLARQGIKALLPVLGAVLTVPAAFAANWAIGRVALEYFKHPDLTREQVRALYKKARDEGARLFSRQKLDAFRQKNPATPRAEPRAEPRAAPGRPARRRPAASKKTIGRRRGVR